MLGASGTLLSVRLPISVWLCLSTVLDSALHVTLMIDLETSVSVCLCHSASLSRLCLYVELFGLFCFPVSLYACFVLCLCLCLPISISTVRLNHYFSPVFSSPYPSAISLDGSQIVSAYDCSSASSHWPLTPQVKAASVNYCNLTAD